MFKKQKQQTRLGDILISKGLITQEQLDKAIQEQGRRKNLLDPADTNAKVTPLGEILIEMQFIDRMQLKRGLNWQQRLRHASIAMALCAPFMMFMPNIARAAPITIQAENYTSMSGVRNENTLDVGGGKNVGYIDAGDWIRYKGIINIPVTGTYKITFRVASSSGGSFQLKDLSGKLIDTITVPATGGLQTWVDVERTIPLTAGSNDWNIRSITGGFNINWMKVELAGDEATAPPVTAPALTIQAENYSTMSGVFNEATADAGGGQNTGNINPGDWMTYNGIALPVSGTYKITYRVASLSAGGTFQLKSATGAVIDTVTVPVTGAWQNWVDVERTVTLAAGSNNLTLLATAGGFNVNWFKIETISSIPKLFSTSIEAESYSSMSGVMRETTDDAGGGINIGGINAGDWMTYDKISVPVSGSYKITYRVASLDGGGLLQLKSSIGSAFESINVPATGGWQKWQDIEQVVTLSAGTHNLTLLALVGGFNVNWIKVESADQTSNPVSPPPVTPNVVSSSSSSFVSSATSSVESSAVNSLAPSAVVIQAENYSTMSGVMRESTADVGGGINIGGLSTGDWMVYNGIALPVSGTYKIIYRVASMDAGGTFQLKSATGAVIDTVTVPDTGGWQKWVDVERTVTLPAGSNNLTLQVTEGGFNVNWFKIETISSTTTLFSTSIEAESYSSMSGVMRETTADVGGGINIGGINAGDWMTYDKVSVPVSGSYKITYRVASFDGGGVLQLKSSIGSAFESINVPATGGWQKWQDIEQVVTLSAGTHNLTLLALVGGFNVNWIKVEPVDQTSNPISPPPFTSSVASSSSSSAPSTITSSSSSSKPSTAVSSSWSSSSTANNAQHVAGPVGITWTPPNARENGEYLDVTELGGYEIRYKKASDSTFTYISINDAWTTSYQFEWLEGDYVFQIAAFDKNGVYSPFVDIQRQ